MAIRAITEADFSKNKNHYFPGEAIIIIENVGDAFTSIAERTIYTEAGVEFGATTDFVEAMVGTVDTGTMFTLRRDVKSVSFTLKFKTREVYPAVFSMAQGGTFNDSATLGAMTGKKITFDGTLPPTLQFRIIMQQTDTDKYIVVTIPVGQSSEIANLTKDDYFGIPVTISANIDPTDATTYPTVFFQD